MPELTGLHIEFQRPVTDAPDLLNGMSDLMKHAPDLPVAALKQRDLEPRIRRIAYQLDARRSRLHGSRSTSHRAARRCRHLQRRALRRKMNATAQFVEPLFRGLAAHLHEVSLRDVRSSVCQ